jgi:hypothetical protein
MSNLLSYELYYVPDEESWNVKYVEFCIIIHNLDAEFDG